MTAPAKSRTSFWSAQALTAGAGNINSSWIDLSTTFEETITIILTNGATGPTVAAQVEVQVANDYNAGSPTLIGSLGIFQGGTANNEVDKFGLRIDSGWEAVRLVAGSNTGQNVTVDADISKVTGIA